MENIRFLNEHETAEYLKLSKKTLGKWRWLGRGPRFHKFGSSVRYSLVDINAFVEKAEIAQ